MEFIYQVEQMAWLLLKASHMVLDRLGLVYIRGLNEPDQIRQGARSWHHRRVVVPALTTGHGAGFQSW